MSFCTYIKKINFINSSPKEALFQLLKFKESKGVKNDLRRESLIAYMSKLGKSRKSPV